MAFLLKGRLLILIAVRKGIHFGVVEQGALAISPGETLRADAKVVVLNELGTMEMLHVFLLGKIGVHHANTDGWHRHEQSEVSPETN